MSLDRFGTDDRGNQDRQEYLEYCTEEGLEPLEEDSFVAWKEYEDELAEERAGDDWDQMDENDREGWEHNMNKD